MPMFDIVHLTRYRYRRQVGFGEHRLMLRPLEALDQSLLRFDLRVGPEPAQVVERLDPFGNAVTRLTFDRCARQLEIEARMQVETSPAPDLAQASEIFPEKGAPFLYAPAELRALRSALALDPAEAQAGEVFARRFAPANGRGSVALALAAMNAAIREDFAYEQRLFDPPRPAAQTLARRAGSCRDFAVLMTAAARRLGVASRFVSGYLADARGHVGGGHTHAWVRCFLPSLGWIDFDPTNALVGGEQLVRVATADDPHAITVVGGTWWGDADDYLGMDVEVSVTPRQELRAARA